MKVIVVILGGMLTLFMGGYTPPARAVRPAAGGLGEIVAGAVVSQEFGCTTFELEPADPTCPEGHFHSGIDLAAPLGTPVHAAASGVVETMESSGGYGLHVLVRHDDTTVTLYGHLESVMVSGGRPVESGDEIGRLGSTGLSSGPHVHFEVRLHGRPVNPRSWLKE